ncbi:uncharacterized protein LOC141599669 [Silene latifolia]|uniref:uncharacterized protein LOC141599669 n=1 Tax=Silene latifolia TaxID=37657 RepID=UPI003D776C17
MWVVGLFCLINPININQTSLFSKNPTSQTQFLLPHSLSNSPSSDTHLSHKPVTQKKTLDLFVMESKNNPINSKSIPPIDSPKNDIVGVISEEIVAGIRSDLKEDRVDENSGGRASKGGDELIGFPSPEKPWTIPVGYCRRCCITLDMELDGRIGMWIDPKDGISVVVDGSGLCEDCEYKNSIETDPNWGRSRRISSEERSCEEKCAFVFEFGVGGEG